MVTFRGAALAATAVTAVLSLAACGPLGDAAARGDGTVTPAAPAAAGDGSGAAHAVQALDLVEKRITGVHSVGAEETLSIGEQASATARLRLAWGSGGPHGTITMTFTGGRQAQSMRSLGMSTTMEGRYLPDAAYVRVAAAPAGVMGDKHWLRYTYAQLGTLMGNTAEFGKDFFASNNPVRSVDLLLSAGNLREVGRETVRGVAATHYTGTVDVAAMTAQRAPHLSASQLAAEKRALRAQGITTETIDLWVSADHLPVEAHTTERTNKGLKTATVYYSDFGVPVHVQAPPASDTVDFGALLDRQRQTTRA